MNICLEYFVCEWSLGTVSKALFMSIFVNNVLYASFTTFRPSSIFCLMSMRNVLVECFGLKPCSTGEKRMCGVMFCRTSFFNTLDGVESNAIGLYEVGSVAGLLGFIIETV